MFSYLPEELGSEEQWPKRTSSFSSLHKLRLRLVWRKGSPSFLFFWAQDCKTKHWSLCFCLQPPPGPPLSPHAVKAHLVSAHTQTHRTDRNQQVRMCEHRHMHTPPLVLGREWEMSFAVQDGGWVRVCSPPWKIPVPAVQSSSQACRAHTLCRKWGGLHSCFLLQIYKRFAQVFVLFFYFFHNLKWGMQ